VLLLAVAAPGIAELVSSSAPPLEFFVPWVFALFVLFYGGSAVLIREMTLRWNSGWRGVLLLGGAFGILLEGISTRAFFDPAWASLGPMAGQGYWLGVNWTWMFDAILYHAVFSTALPILLVYQVAPKYRREAWLDKRGLGIAGLLFVFGAAVFIQSGKNRYPAPYSYLAFCVVAIVILGVLAYRTKASVPRPGEARPAKASHFAILSFCATLAMILQIYALPRLAHAPWLPGAALAFLVFVSTSLLLKWSGGQMTYAQCFWLLAGALGCFALLDFFQELNPARGGVARGMSVIGVATLVGLYFLRKKAVAFDESAVETAPGHSPAMSYALAQNQALWPAPAVGHLELSSWESVTNGIPRLAQGVPPLWRVFEVVVGAAALILTFPIMLLLGILIRRGTPGPALFHQPRIGVNGRIFRFVKFRTLYADARQRFPELYAYRYTGDELQNLKFKIVNDPRVTPQGRWMRTTTLDELPNFWNVVCGHMALVGPRPEIPEMLPYYKGIMLRKFSVRPGITGLAQISGRGRLGFYETADLDVEYVMNRSIMLDLKIIALTLYKLITRDGAF
jgi:lipopolysaccharide/colanic/teichoic acid biosynthesis glycosyltransferase